MGILKNTREVQRGTRLRASLHFSRVLKNSRVLISLNNALGAFFISLVHVYTPRSKLDLLVFVYTPRKTKVRFIILPNKQVQQETTFQMSEIAVVTLTPFSHG